MKVVFAPSLNEIQRNKEIKNSINSSENINKISYSSNEYSK